MLPTLRGLCAFELIQAINVPTAEANNYIYSNYVSNHWGMRKEMSFFFFFFLQSILRLYVIGQDPLNIE